MHPGQVAMAAMEPDEWCWDNPRQYPVQELLDCLCRAHILQDSDARKAMIFFNWSKVAASLCLSAVCGIIMMG